MSPLKAFLQTCTSCQPDFHVPFFIRTQEAYVLQGAHVGLHNAYASGPGLLGRRKVILQGARGRC